MSTVTMATFRAGGLVLGVDVTRVQEVLGGQRIIPVPRAPAGVLGLVNLRGRIVAATDCRFRLGLPPREPGDGGAHVIIRTGTQVDSLVVDREGDVVDVDPADRVDAPDTVDAVIRSRVTGAYPRVGELLLALDVDRVLFARDEEGEVPHAGAGHRRLPGHEDDPRPDPAGHRP